MVRLLLGFGADPRAVDFAEVLETCDREMMNTFIEAGVDPCAQNALARALATTRHPILGFVKQYRDRFPAIQRQIDIALRVAVEKDRERGVALMLWLGGDPYATTPSSAEKGEDDSYCSSAIESAMWRKPEILDALLKRPIPDGQLNQILDSAAARCLPRLVERLLKQGANPNYVSEEGRPLLWRFISPVLWIFRTSKEEVDRGLEALEIVLKAGATFQLSDEDLKRFRRDLLDGESRVVIRVIELLEQHRVLSPEQIRELTRTPSMKKILAGHSKPRRSFGWEPVAPLPAYSPPPPVHESRGGYWKKHWWQR